jgi:hypothetical protein
LAAVRYCHREITQGEIDREAAGAVQTGLDGDSDIGTLVRPYALTGGRTRPVVDVAIESLLAATPYGQARAEAGGGGTIDLHVLRLCQRRLQSLAEIAALSRLPLGVARVLVGDMIIAGLLALAGSSAPADSTDILSRVLSGLRSL